MFKYCSVYVGSVLSLCWDKLERTDTDTMKDKISVWGQGTISITGFKKHFEVGEFMEVYINRDSQHAAFKPIKEPTESASIIRLMHDSIVFTPPPFVKGHELKKGRYPAHWDDNKKWIVVDLSECDQSNVR